MTDFDVFNIHKTLNNFWTLSEKWFFLKNGRIRIFRKFTNTFQDFYSSHWAARKSSFVRCRSRDTEVALASLSHARTSEPPTILRQHSRSRDRNVNGDRLRSAKDTGNPTTALPDVTLCMTEIPSGLNPERDFFFLVSLYPADYALIRNIFGAPDVTLKYFWPNLGPRDPLGINYPKKINLDRCPVIKIPDITILISNQPFFFPANETTRAVIKDVNRFLLWAKVELSPLTAREYFSKNFKTIECSSTCAFLCLRLTTFYFLIECLSIAITICQRGIDVMVEFTGSRPCKLRYLRVMCDKLVDEPPETCYCFATS